MWRWLLIAPFLVVLVLFTLSNTQDIDLRFWPFDFVWQAPLALAVLGVAAVTFLLGALIAWLAGMSWRTRAKRAEKGLAKTQGELASVKAADEQRRSQALTTLPPAA